MPRALLTSFQSYKSSQALLLFHCFSDVDECATRTHNCSEHAVCNNTNGGHNCTCKKGFIGDGENCTGEILPYQHVFFATFQLAPNLALFLLRRFPLNVRAISGKIKLPKKLLIAW